MKTLLLVMLLAVSGSAQLPTPKDSAGWVNCASCVGVKTDGSPAVSSQSGWWILLRKMSGQIGDVEIPRVAGPYPSQELCRLAGYSIDPDDRRFWTEEMRTKVEREEKIKVEARTKEIEIVKEQVRSGKRKPGWIKLSDGSSIGIQPNGELESLTAGALTLSGTGWVTWSRTYEAITPCVEIKSGEVSK